MKKELKLFVVDEDYEYPTTLKVIEKENDFNEIEKKELNELKVGETCNLFFAPVKRIK